MDRLAHRKAAAQVRLLRPDGSPAANCPVRVDQCSHDFLFGCGAGDAVGMLFAPDEARRRKHAERMEKWLELFNYGTLHFYWGRYEREPGKTMEAPLKEAARWLRERGVTLKGHPLCWHTVCADWLLQYDNAEILRRQLARIDREVKAFRGLIGLWDVINEVVIMPDFDKYDNAVTRICRDRGRIGLVKDVFAAAKAADPGAVLLINDFNTSVAYEILLEGLLEAGVPIGAIGIQSHQHQGYWGLEKLESVLARYARFGLPLHFTENTLISGALMPPHIVDLNDWQVDEWPTTPEGEERQAREITEMYTALFSHPAVEAITTWDFSDECWLNAPAGLVRRDNSEKPAYQALRSLIHGEWETHTRAVTDAEGRFAFTGFKGGYRLSCGDAAVPMALSADGAFTLRLEEA